MKNNPIDRMKDPFYAGLLFKIEQMICQADDEAMSIGQKLTDSQIRSALIKARKKAGGGKPDIPHTNKRERIVAELINSLLYAPDELFEQTTANDGTIQEKPLKLSDWIKALETIEDSIKTRKSSIPGSRDYLEFAHKFIEQTKGKK